MAIVAKNSGGGSFELVPADNHLGLCYQVIDLGTQKESFQGKEKLQRKIRITFELPDIQKEFKQGEGLKPYTISKEYTLSLSEKSNLRKDLQSWRGKPFTEEELEGFDLARLLGKPCLIQVIHKDGANGKYSMIQSITSMPKSMNAPKEAVNPILEFSMDEFSQDKFDKLPTYIQEKIQESMEFKEGLHKQNSSNSEVDDSIF